MLSPRALQQGWKEELDSNIGQHKQWITRRKLEAVLDASLPARKLEEEVRKIELIQLVVLVTRFCEITYLPLSIPPIL